MHASPLTPVVTTLRLSLHVLVTALAVVVIARASVPGAQHQLPVIVLAGVWLLIYFLGAVRMAPTQVSVETWPVRLWLGALTLCWLGLVALAPDAGYLAFGLFFLFLHLLVKPWNLVAVVLATAVAVVGFGVHRGWSVAGVVGPILGAAVAVGIGFGYRALFRESAQRQRLIDELLSTRAVLAERERTAGKLAERERLAEEIHDTVAQGLSSIQLLLHAAELALDGAADVVRPERKSIAPEAVGSGRGQARSAAEGRDDLANGRAGLTNTGQEDSGAHENAVPPDSIERAGLDPNQVERQGAACAPRSPATKESRFDDAIAQIRLARMTAAENLSETRRLIAELAPVALEGRSLAQALERICARTETSRLRAELSVEGEPVRLSMPIEAALVRIAQGAVSNVVRHASASRMRLTLTYSDTEVYFDVVDDGVGIDPSVLSQPPAGSFGLRAMRQRVAQQGGTMTVESEPGHTAVTVTFPLTDAPASVGRDDR